MRDEFIQNIDQAYLEQFLATASDNPQALVLSAYLEEKAKWDEKLNTLILYKDTIVQKAIGLEKVVDEKRDAINKAQADLHNESGILVWLLKLIGIKTRAERRFHKIFKEAHELTSELKELNDEFINVLEEYDKTAANPPDARQYELAMIGNTLFKPR
jgi:hypothetical protein